MNRLTLYLTLCNNPRIIDKYLWTGLKMFLVWNVAASCLVVISSFMTSRYIITNGLNEIQPVGLHKTRNLDSTKWGPPLTPKSLTRFPLPRFLAYVHVIGGISVSRGPQYSPTNTSFMYHGFFQVPKCVQYLMLSMIPRGNNYV